jgi:hypothetical protein
MSRGLSQQQRQILGIAVHVNRHTQGGTPAVKTGAPLPNSRVPTVDYRGVKDLQWPLPAHLLKGLAFVEVDTKIEKTNGVRQDAGNFFDLTVPQAQSAKASIVRAISRLQREGFLMLAPQGSPFRWGYVLTETGLQLGRQSEYPFPPPLIFRAGLLTYPGEASSGFSRTYASLVQGALTLSTILETGERLAPMSSDYQFAYALYKALGQTRVGGQ